MTISKKIPPKSVKLYQWNKDSIVRKMMDRWDEKNPMTAITEMENNLAVKIYNLMYTKEQQDQMNSLPEGVCQKVSYITVRPNMMYYQYIPVELPEPRPFWYLHMQNRNAQPSPECHYWSAVVSDFNDLQSAKSKRKEKRKEAENALKSTLKSINTTKQAREMWPEIEPFLPEPKEEPKALVIVTPDLNKTFDLPVEAN